MPLADRGRRLLAALTADGGMPEGRRVLAEEAARLADRLDQLDAFLRGDSRQWITLRDETRDGDEETRIVVVVDKALGEARQHALALRQVIAEVSAKAEAPPKGDDLGDELAAARARRLADAAGR